MYSSAWPAPLAGQTILVAEDEALISFDIEAFLNEAGANVVAAKDQRGGLLAAARPDLTAAVIDVRLGPGSVDPICHCLDRSCVPFVFLTGDSGKDVQKWAAPILSKPFDGRVLTDTLVRILVTGGDVLDLADKTRIDRIIFAAEARLLRQERVVREVTHRQQELRNADELLRIMRGSVELLHRHRRRLMADAEELH